MRPDLSLAFEVGDRARNFEDPMIAARGQTQTDAGALQQNARFGVNRCVRVKPSACDVRVAQHARMSGVALALP